MITHRGAFAILASVALLALAIFAPSVADGEPKPAWKFTITSQPTYFSPGSSAKAHYILLATNVGAGIAEGSGGGEITVENTLPDGLTALGAGAFSEDPAAKDFACTIENDDKTVKCKGEGPVHPGYSMWVDIALEVSAPEGEVLPNEATIEGGGALPQVAATLTTVSDSVPPFEFLEADPGFSAPVVAEDGSAAEGAGSHPYGAILDLGFPTEKPGGVFTSVGHLRDVSIDFPRGMLANPLATATHCTEAELASEGLPGCPNSSVIGVVTILTAIELPFPSATPLYNMEPPPGSPAAFGFDAIGAGIFGHTIASVRADDDYGATGTTNDIIARGLNPILDVRAELWGNPTDTAHDNVRNFCIFGDPPPCETDPDATAFLTLPGDCPGGSLLFRAHARSWEEAEEIQEAQYESAEINEGALTEVSGCGELEFEPKIKAQPTTNLIDSPSGLDFTLTQPQELELGPEYEGLYTAVVKDTTVTFPEGMGVNASLANGLEACSAAQIGLNTGIGQSPIRFDEEPAACPDASKIGKVSATSPLLDHPVEGALYVAKPFDNPFNTLTAVYLAIEDPRSGIVAKFAGEVKPNPITGQLATTVTEAPQLPIEELKVNLFTGARAPLQTPPTCAVHTTVATLTPWSAPEGSPATVSDSFAPTATPGGGTCPTSAAGAPNAPTLRAGTLSPQAGAFSPLVLNLARQDGTQRLGALEATLPPGLLARLAGVPYCSEAQIAAAVARSQPGQGALEVADPSCPAASEVGTVDVGAGAGPSPLHVAGRAYLAPPYKGAPLSMVIITPAIAGPFDLGVVAVRSALRVDPTTAQGRAVSDPLPTILHGIPVDVRSVAVEVSRPNFTLNPTNCNPLAFNAAAISVFGQAAPLSAHFQVGGCGALPFKPKLTTRLFGPTRRGANPRFRAIFTAKPGEANSARVVTAFPHSVFIDQAHIRTICTRVQFAADDCPAGSIYGHVKATSPLVDYTLEGPIYLRSSNNELPDAVLALRGPPHQPVEAELAGRIDSVNGGIRVTFETVPDVPVTKAIVTLQGAKKGIYQNSTNLCRANYRMNVNVVGQNGKRHHSNPLLRVDCPKKKGKGKGKRR